MDDKQLDRLLQELSDVTVSPSNRLIYEAREKASRQALRREKKREWAPFVIVILLNILLVVGETIFMVCLSTSMQQISIIVGVGVFSMQLPIAAYLLGKIYYKDKELERR